MKTKLVALFLALSAFSFAGYKEDLEKRMEKFEKTLNYDGTSAEMNETAIKHSEEWEKELKIIYQKLLKELDNQELPESKKKLISGQKHWESFKADDSAFQSFVVSTDGVGRISTQIYYGVEIEMNKNRALELARIYDFLTE